MNMSWITKRDEDVAVSLQELVKPGTTLNGQAVAINPDRAWRQILDVRNIPDAARLDEFGTPIVDLDEQWAALDVLWMQACLLSGTRAPRAAIATAQLFAREILAHLGGMLEQVVLMSSQLGEAFASANARPCIGLLEHYAKACSWCVRWLLVDYQVLPKRAAQAMFCGLKAAHLLRHGLAKDDRLQEAYRHLKVTLLLMGGNAYTFMPDEIDQAWHVLFELSPQFEVEPMNTGVVSQGSVLLVDVSAVRVLYLAEISESERPAPAFFLVHEPNQRGTGGSNLLAQIQ